MKIDIQIKDEKRFTDVALVADQEEFLEEIEKIRKIYKVDKLWSKQRYVNFRRDIYFKKAQKKKLEEAIESVRKRLRLSHTFLRVIEKAIFCGRVADKDYSPAILAKHREGGTRYDEYCIILSPEARDKDVIEALGEYRDEVKNYLSHNLKGYKFIPVSRNELVKGKPSIKDHRQWYLDYYESSIPLEDISQKCIDSCPIKEEHDVGRNKPKGCRCFDTSTIRKGVDNYKSLLWKSRTS